MASAFVAVGLVFASAIASRAAMHAVRVRYRDQSIAVTGSARHRIRSDLIVWHARVTARAATQHEAYALLAPMVPRVRTFIEQRGVPASEISVQAVATEALHARAENGLEIPEQVVGYVLTQALVVGSHDVDRVAAVARDVTQLIDEGIAVESDAPSYLYTRLATLKIELLAAAARDARARAEQIAQQTHARLGALANARMGVIQVNAANETDVSAEGVNDTASLDKDAFAVVSAMFYTE